MLDYVILFFVLTAVTVALGFRTFAGSPAIGARMPGDCSAVSLVMAVYRGTVPIPRAKPYPSREAPPPAA